MATSPEQDGEGVLQFSVLSEGVESTSYIVLSATIRHALNRVPWAELVVYDGDMPTGAFAVSDSATFSPGKKISIRAGYGNNKTELFSGIVVRHGIKIDGANHSRLIVECRDAATKMTIGRNCANHLEKTDSDIMTTLISKYGLTADVQSTSTTHRELVQYYASDWDFMLVRAEVNGLLVNVAGGKVSIKPPDASSAAVLSVKWGEDLFSFEADMDARQQLTAVQATAWSAKEQNVIQSESAKPAALNSQGDLDGETLAKVASPATFALLTSTAQDQTVLTAWAKAAQQKAALARIRGAMRFLGNAAAVPGCLIDVQGVGTHFQGSVFVSAVEHAFSEGVWMTDVEFGMSADWHTARTDVMAPAAGGLLPGVVGLQIGVVVKLDGDPDGEQRIQVKLPVMQAENANVWARLLQGYASNTFGLFLLPEVGDEVLIGYLNDDPSHPVVLGSLYSSARKPPYEIEAKNNTKALVTRAKHKIELNEEDKIITITTPGNNKVVLDDKDKSILLQDQNNNSVKLSGSGIAMTSPFDISLKADGNITLDATKAVNIKAVTDVKVTGMNVNCEAQVGFVGKGSATAEVSAAGQTTIKGALVMIN